LVQNQKYCGEILFTDENGRMPKFVYKYYVCFRLIRSL
jgi:hypothetical protein